MTTTMTDLYNGFYNQLTTALGLSTKSFQMLQPAVPLMKGDDQALWSFLDDIPPATLNQEYTAAGGDSFFQMYERLIGALSPTTKANPEKAIGGSWTEWTAHLGSLKPTPSVQQLPSLFRKWAMINAPQVANAGVAAYSQILLDPVAAAQTELTSCYGPGKNPDWHEGYADLAKALANAPKETLTTSSSTMNSSFSGSWSDSGASAFFGVWSESDSSSAVSSTFAASEIKVDASFEHLLTFDAAPVGPWYESAAMGMAYSNPGKAPWDPTNTATTWDTIFGSPGGTMQRFAANLIVASGVNLTVTSKATYSAAAQAEIQSHEHAGLWPFYCQHSDNTDVVNNATFEGDTMTITMTSKPGVPIVLGVTVLPAATYIGTASQLAAAG